MRLLIVDDNSDWAYTVSMWLENSVYDYEIVTNGHSAMDLLSKKIFDLVVIDLFMPSISGIKLYELIKQKYDIKIILMSGIREDGLGRIKPKCTFYQKPLHGEDYVYILDNECPTTNRITYENITC